VLRRWHSEVLTERERRVMRMRKSLFIGVCLAALSTGALAQVTGSGTANTVPVFTGSGSSVGDSPISVSGGNVGIGTASPKGNLEVS